MTFEDYWGRYPEPDKVAAEHAWNAGQAAEREQIKSRVKSAAESLWCIRNQGDAAYELYIGPSLNTLEQFVEKLLEEE